MLHAINGAGQRLTGETPSILETFLGFIEIDGFCTVNFDRQG